MVFSWSLFETSCRHEYIVYYIEYFIIVTEMGGSELGQLLEKKGEKVKLIIKAYLESK